jgi:multicomponent Na+:H+ antiporter subunit G
MMLETLGFGIMIIGGIISVIGSLGLVRFPDVYSRSHAQTVVNVGGACLMLIGAAFEMSGVTSIAKIAFLILLVFATSPVGTHAITKAAYKSGVIPKVSKDEWKPMSEKEDKKAGAEAKK